MIVGFWIFQNEEEQQKQGANDAGSKGSDEFAIP